MKRILSGNSADWRGEAFIQNNPYPGPTKTRGEDKEPQPKVDMRERCVVTATWKLILNTSRPPELYDRRSPQPDTENVYGRPETDAVVRELADRMTAWAGQTGDEIAARLVGQWVPASVAIS